MAYRTNQQSIVINIMKGLLPILVVALHTSYDSTICWRDGVEPFIRVLITKVGGIAVPSFFLISGFFFFTKLNRWDWHIWIGKMEKRIFTLVVPFILWILIDIVAKYLWGVSKGEIDGFNLLSLREYLINNGGLRMFWDMPQNTGSVNIFGWFLNTSKPINAPMWYVRDLVILMGLSPLLYLLIYSSKGWIMVFFFFLNTFDIGFPFILFSPTALFYFSVGAYFSMSGNEFIAFFRRFTIPSIIVASILLITVFAFDGSMLGEVFFRLFVCFGVVSCFCLVDLLYSTKQIKECRLLTDSSFFIYASHGVLITEISNFILWRLLPITAGWMLVLKVFLRPALSILICLFLYKGMKRITPRVLELLTGGRG